MLMNFADELLRGDAIDARVTIGEQVTAARGEMGGFDAA
jgi:hypothetical protein